MRRSRNNDYCEPCLPEEAYSALPERCGCGGKLSLITNGRIGFGLTYYKCELSADGGVHDTKLWDRVVTDELVRLRSRVDNDMEIRTSGIESKVDNLQQLLDMYGEQLMDIKRSNDEKRRSYRFIKNVSSVVASTLWDFFVTFTSAAGKIAKDQVRAHPLSCAALLCLLLNLTLAVYSRNV